MTTPRATLGDLAPALDRVAEILARNESRHGHDEWKRRSVQHHVRHAAIHLRAYAAGDRTEDHLGHAGCRVLMAIVRAAEEEAS